MPSTIKVKVKAIENSTRGKFNGLEVSGYDATNNKGYKQFTFETTQKGDLTKVAEALQNVGAGDWIEIEQDDTKYKNITKVSKCAEPAGGSPSGGGGSNSGGGGAGGNDRMSKAEWAEKDRKKEVSISRQSALKHAVAAMGDAKLTKATAEAIEKLAHRFEAFLMTGDFNGTVDTPEKTKPVEKDPRPTDAREPGDDTPVTPADDDIPF
jgi:hypothetical protein